MIPNDTRADVELVYLLEEERLTDASPEMAAVDQVAAQVGEILRQTYGETGLTIREGGSKAKGTMLKCAYDLDLLCYFDRENDVAGDTLEDIYHDVRRTLSQHFYVHQGRTALRLRVKDGGLLGGAALHVDVVPGRFIDATLTKVFLYQNEGSKERLMTDPLVHIDHVKNSGMLEELCLMKLWRIQHGLVLRQFPFELLSLDLMRPHKGHGLANQVVQAFKTIADAATPPSVIDPANPNNDLSRLMTGNAWDQMRRQAGASLRDLETMSWSDVLRGASRPASPKVLDAAVASSSTKTPPWSC